MVDLVLEQGSKTVPNEPEESERKLGTGNWLVSDAGMASGYETISNT
jgi:hypothetical protein